MSFLNFRGTPLDQIYVVSDLHGYHKNITRGVTSWDMSNLRDGNSVRDFDTIEEMTQTLIKNINDRVPYDGILISLGDWSFGGLENIAKLRNQINCQKIYHICGNHDHHFEKPAVRELFTGVFGHHKTSDIVLLEAGVKVQHYIMCHYKMAVWPENNRGYRHLWGHSHGSYPDSQNELSLDVGVDSRVMKYGPQSLAYLEGHVFNKKKYVPIDHHKVGV